MNTSYIINVFFYMIINSFSIVINYLFTDFNYSIKSLIQN
jgi:hypothetical protein